MVRGTKQVFAITAEDATERSSEFAQGGRKFSQQFRDFPRLSATFRSCLYQTLSDTHSVPRPEVSCRLRSQPRASPRRVLRLPSLGYFRNSATESQFLSCFSVRSFFFVNRRDEEDAGRRLSPCIFDGLTFFQILRLLLLCGYLLIAQSWTGKFARLVSEPASLRVLAQSGERMRLSITKAEVSSISR